MNESETVADVRLNESEKKLIVNSLLCFRHELGEKGIPTQDINDLILKIIEAQSKTITRRDDREER